MNEEEKREYEELKSLLYTGTISQYGKRKLIDIIERQQKEIEKLEDKNKTLERLLQGDLYEMYKYYRELVNSYQANCISKDKIKEKIEEVEKKKEKTEILDFKAFYSIKEIKNIEINILKEILGE